MILQEEVLSEGDGLRLLGELVHDKIVPKDVIPVFSNHATYHLDNDGKVVMDTTIVTIMQVEEVECHTSKTRLKRKHESVRLAD